MSLVHEALQKTEREKQRKLDTAPGAPVSPSAPPAIPTPIIHTPVVPATEAYAPRTAAPRRPTAPTEVPPKTNNVLLPALIGCVAIVAMIAIVFLVSNATSVMRQSRETPPVAAAPAPAPVAQPTSPAARQLTAPPSADSPAPANAAPPATPVIDESKYKLSGIMKDPDGKPVAVLDGRVAYEGYFIDGATVKRIETDRVTLDVKGHEIVLRLY